MSIGKSVYHIMLDGRLIFVSQTKRGAESYIKRLKELEACERKSSFIETSLDFTKHYTIIEKEV